MAVKQFEIVNRGRERVIIQFSADAVALNPDQTYTRFLEGEAVGIVHLHVGETLREKDGLTIEAR